jgi:hypothetical protein
MSEFEKFLLNRLRLITEELAKIGAHISEAGCALWLIAFVLIVTQCGGAK